MASCAAHSSQPIASVMSTFQVMVNGRPAARAGGAARS